MEKKFAPKVKTINSIIVSFIWGAILFVVILILLSQLGLNIIPLLTGAGILGLALSLGAQSIIKDFFAGMLIIFEGQYNLGDRVRIGEHTGRVYKITLRVTVLQDLKNNLVYIPNSEIKTVVRLRR